MKTFIALSIALLVSSFAFANTTDSTIVKTGCFDDAKIKTSDKHFFVSFSVKGKDGLLHVGYTGCSLSHGVPNTLILQDYIARKAGVHFEDVRVAQPSEISCSEYHDLFKNKYGKIILSKKG